MENEIVLSPSGLEEKQEVEIKNGLSTIIKEREALVESFENVIQEEISEENIPMFKSLRLQIRDNRTKGIEPWHKANKAYFWNGGKFVDSIKNKEVLINQRMEDALMSCEKHFELQEEKRLKDLQEEREGLISGFLFEGEEHREYAKMDDELWKAIFESKKKAHAEHLETEKKAKEERIAREKAEEDARIAMIAENEKLKKEAEAKEKADKEEESKRARIDFSRIQAESKAKAIFEAKLKAEQDDKQKIEDELKAQKEAETARIAKEKQEELNAIEEAEAKEQALLKRGDSEKVQDLKADLEALKTKYSFKSAKYKKTYSDVNTLIDKVINHINQ